MNVPMQCSYQIQIFLAIIFTSDRTLRSHFLYTVNLEKSRPKMFLLISHQIDGKVASFLAYMKSICVVVLVFGNEHANWSNIKGIMIE